MELYNSNNYKTSNFMFDECDNKNAIFILMHNKNAAPLNKQSTVSAFYFNQRLAAWNYHGNPKDHRFLMAAAVWIHQLSDCPVHQSGTDVFPILSAKCLEYKTLMA